ncbi:MAG: DnaJ C-terminal domain-containing protein [Patescibacteria group bacterium]
MASNDYYQILGVSKNASDAELKSAYRKKALEWHPDRNKTSGATEKFKEINEAYEVLSNPQKKQTYDQFGADAFKQGAQSGQGPFSYTYRTYGSGMDFSDFSDPFEIFEQFFGGGFSTGRSRPRRAVYQLTLTFLEAAKGVERTVDINGRPSKIKIPAGVDEGTRVRFGDFDIIVSIASDKVFQREGLNVVINFDLDFVSAILGTEISVPTIEGPVKLKVPSGAQPDTVIRLRGHGIRDPRYNRAGDQYVRLKVKVPTKLSGDQKRLLEQYQETQNSKPRSGWF